MRRFLLLSGVALTAALTVPSEHLVSCTPVFQQPASSGPGCYTFDLCGLPYSTFLVNDSFPEPYLITSPCHVAATAACSACNGVAVAASAVQMDNCSGHRCLQLGTLAGPVISPATADPSTSLELLFAGGDGGRTLVYHFTCASGLPASAGPTTVVEGPPLVYTVTWPTPLACPTFNASDSCAPPVPALAIPTASQLQWLADDIGAIGHFNMGTFEACGIGSTRSNRSLTSVVLPPPQTFAPTNVDVPGWIAALASLGAKHAVLVVSHGCGFNTFPSATQFPEFDFTYNYSIVNSPWKNGDGDIAAEFVDACRQNGIRPGFYHGAMNNAFLNVIDGVVSPNYIPGQARVTQEQYGQILLANLRQLWSSYGELAEVWFDGGYPEGTGDAIAALLQELQPNAVAFQGPGNNTIRWCGTESGHVAYPFWSTAASSGDAGAGAPADAVFTPGEADTCLQTGAGQEQAPYGGCWFYNAGMVPKSLAELVSTYHDSVGSNAILLLDWTPTPEGILRADHVTRYAEFGNWIRACYGVPVARVANATGFSFVVAVPGGRVFDRVVLKEEQTYGQRIRSYVISVQHAGGGPWTSVGTGSSVGNKRIHLLGQYVAGALAVQVNVTAVGTPTLVDLALYNCSLTPSPSGCSFQTNFAYKIVPSITIKVLPTTSPADCCTACAGLSACAVFVVDAQQACTLLSANQGGNAQAGCVSGSPNA